MEDRRRFKFLLTTMASVFIVPLILLGLLSNIVEPEGTERRFSEVFRRERQYAHPFGFLRS
jgi:hypothetical protein